MKSKIERVAVEGARRRWPRLHGRLPLAWLTVRISCMAARRKSVPTVYWR